MDRRTFLYDVGGLAAAAALPRSVARYATRAARHAPNILYIVSDDLGYADLGVTGRTDYRTPVIDGIARDGALLTQAYSSAPVCTPTRVAFMTGRYPARYTAGERPASRPVSPSASAQRAQPRRKPRSQRGKP